MSLANESWQPLVLAHRGLWVEGSAENSSDAFRRAAEQGFFSECDVWESADGVPVVIHDESLDRTTTGKGKVSDYPVAELRRFQCRLPGLPGGAKPLFEPVPLLSDVAGFIGAVEVKPADARNLVARVIPIMASRSWLLQSFDATNLYHARSVNPSVRVALLLDDLAGLETAIENRWPAHLNHELLDERIARRLRDAGLGIGVWTVNTDEQIRRIVALRPDLIISDYPHRVRQILRAQGVEPGALRDRQPKIQ